MEALYQILADHSRAGVYIVQDGRFQFLNYNAAQYAGYLPEELMGVDSFSIVHPEDREIAKENAIKMLKGEDRSPYEFRIVTKDGRLRWIMETVTYIEYHGKKAILGNSMDITENKDAEKKLKSLEELESSILDAIPHAVLGLKSRRVIFANDAAEAVFGWTPAEIIGSTTQILYRCDEDFRQVGEHIYALLKEKRTCSLYVPCRHKEGRDILCRLTASVIGSALIDDAIVAVFEDVTIHRQMEESLRQSEEKYRSILANIEEAYYEVDLTGNLTFFNDTLATDLGYTELELKEMNYRQFVDQANANIVFSTFNEVFRTGIAAKQFDWELIKKNGERVIAEASISLMRNGKGNPVGFRGIVRDVTERKRVEEMIKSMAYHDSLTGLPNRRLLRDRLDMTIAQAGRHHSLFAVVMMDLDKFKEINDSLGHDTGDQLLQSVAIRMKELLRKGDTIARMGGDEFMLLLSDLRKRQDGIDVAERILEAFKETFILERHILSITTSIGIAFYPEDGPDSESLMKGADISMYCAKGQGRNRYCCCGDVTPVRSTSSSVPMG